MRLTERLEKSSLNRNDCVRVMKNWTQFVAITDGLQSISDPLYQMLFCSMRYEPREIPEEHPTHTYKFQSEAQWLSDDGFVYHVGYFIETYHSLEMFSNYSLEACHAENALSFQQSQKGGGAKRKREETIAAKGPTPTKAAKITKYGLKKSILRRELSFQYKPPQRV
eukprot:TRINITY_DN1348_c0_g1_i1.p3 TRINITY_DN1348_c0_g1~~TRINITY_DN1348_c0_g1_i1.p3  ORF type:complete len:167 (+),score=16.75 TRINITY_DN1348_c0_g1_i1:1632-2132(+)